MKTMILTLLASLMMPTMATADTFPNATTIKASSHHHPHDRRRPAPRTSKRDQFIQAFDFVLDRLDDSKDEYIYRCDYERTQWALNRAIDEMSRIEYMIDDWTFGDDAYLMKQDLRYAARALVQLHDDVYYDSPSDRDFRYTVNDVEQALHGIYDYILDVLW